MGLKKIKLRTFSEGFLDVQLKQMCGPVNEVINSHFESKENPLVAITGKEWLKMIYTHNS